MQAVGLKGLSNEQIDELAASFCTGNKDDLDNIWTFLSWSDAHATTAQRRRFRVALMPLLQRTIREGTLAVLRHDLQEAFDAMVLLRICGEFREDRLDVLRLPGFLEFMDKCLEVEDLECNLYKEAVAMAWGILEFPAVAELYATRSHLFVRDIRTMDAVGVLHLITCLDVGAAGIAQNENVVQQILYEADPERMIDDAMRHFFALSCCAQMSFRGCASPAVDQLFRESIPPTTESILAWIELLTMVEASYEFRWISLEPVLSLFRSGREDVLIFAVISLAHILPNRHNMDLLINDSNAVDLVSCMQWCPLEKPKRLFMEKIMEPFFSKSRNVPPLHVLTEWLLRFYDKK